jgi:hypothetical protein
VREVVGENALEEVPITSDNGTREFGLQLSHLTPRVLRRAVATASAVRREKNREGGTKTESTKPRSSLHDDLPPQAHCPHGVPNVTLKVD